MTENQASKVNLRYLAPICLIATLGGLLLGYDNGVISGAIEPLTAKFTLSATLKGWVSSCVMLGGGLGVLLAGIISDHIGRKKALIFAGPLFVVSALGAAMSTSLGVFVLFRFLSGVAMGFPSTCIPMYIAEITPARLRGRLVTANQIAIVSGITVVYFSNYSIAHCGDQVWNNQYAWRWMFASCLLPAVLFTILLSLIPESPRWLMKNEMETQACAIFERIGGLAFAQEEIANIRGALMQEKGTWKEVFSPGLRKPLFWGISLAVLQQVTGINIFLLFGTTVFRDISQATGVDAGMIQQSVIGVACVVFTLVALAVVDKWGRKPLMFLGVSGMFLGLVSMGVMAQVMTDPSAAGTMILLSMIFYIGCFSLSAGPVIWVLLSELYPTAVRGRALSLATFCMWISDYVVLQTFPMMNKNVWLVARFHHAFPFYVYAGLCLILIFIMYFVPETKGKSLEEIEQSWGRNNKNL
jgi:sugar porter (SP) family MFS transporter